MAARVDEPARARPRPRILVLVRHLTGQVMAMLGPRLGLIRHPRLLDHFEEHDRWTPEEIAEVVEHVFGDDLQPVGHEAREYQRRTAVERSAG